MYTCHYYETSSMSLLQQAVELNNQGIHAIIDHDDGKMATRCLAVAVHTLKAALAAITTTTSGGTAGRFSAIGKAIQEANLVAVPRMEVKNRSCSFKVYNRFICLPSLSATAASAAATCTFKHPADEVMSSSGGAAFGEMDQRIYASAILFNLGLAFQYQGSQPCLKKAERIYNLVIQTMDDLTLLNNRLSLVITLGSINNLAHIWCSNGEYEKGREVSNVVPCLMLMKQLSSSSSSGEGGDNTIFEDPDVHGLLMNIMLLHAPTVAAAA